MDQLAVGIPPDRSATFEGTEVKSAEYERQAA